MGLKHFVADMLDMIGAIIVFVTVTVISLIVFIPVMLLLLPVLIPIAVLALPFAFIAALMKVYVDRNKYKEHKEE